MKILIVEPGQRPRVADIGRSLESMQAVVGGYIRAIYPWKDRVALVCDSEGDFKELLFNRVVAPGVAISGTFFICGLGEVEFDDLPQDLIEKYERLLGDPEVLIQTASGPVVLHLMGFGEEDEDE